MRDPVVATHYASLKLNPAVVRVEELREPIVAHVSYRVGDQVYWTKKKVTLRAGEPVLTDGQTTIRARCGNAVSVAALGPALPDEPAPEQFDLPEDVVVLGGAPPPGDPFVLKPPPPFEPPKPPPPPPVPPRRPNPPDDPHFPPGPPPDDPHFPPGPPPPPPPPLPVPEPGTVVLMGIGGAAGLLAYLRRRRARP